MLPIFVYIFGRNNVTDFCLYFGTKEVYYSFPICHHKTYYYMMPFLLLWL